MRKSIWYNNNIHFFIEYNPISKKNKITPSNINSLFFINKYTVSSIEKTFIFFNLYKKLELNNIYFMYYILFGKYKQSLYFFNKNMINFLFYQAVHINFKKFF